MARYTNDNPYTGKRLLIIACCGEANSVGYGDAYTVPSNDGLVQLGLDGTDNLQVIPLTDTPQNFEVSQASSALAMAYKIREAVLNNYDILIIPVAYADSGFSTDITDVLDTDTLKSQGVSAAFSWKAGLIFSQILVERIKYAMSLNPENVLGGIIWMQGERDAASADTVATHSTEFPKLVEYVEAQLIDYKERSILKSVNKDMWYAATSCVSAYKDELYQDIYNNYKTYLGLDNIIQIPFDAQYQNATMTEFKDVKLVGETIATHLIRDTKFALPYRVLPEVQNIDTDKSSFVDVALPNEYTRLTINELGEIYSNPHETESKQQVIWFNSDVQKLVLDNTASTNPFYLLFKDSDNQEYAILIDDTANTEGNFWKVYKLSDTSTYPITLTEVGNTADNNFKNVFSVLRYSKDGIPNFPSKRQDVYGLGLNAEGSLLVINGYESNKLIATAGENLPFKLGTVSDDKMVVYVTSNQDEETFKELITEKIDIAVETGAINMTNYYNKAEIDGKVITLNERIAKREVDSEEVNNKIEILNASLVAKVDKTTLEANYTNNTDLKKQLLEKADKTDLDAQTTKHNDDIIKLTTAMEKVSDELATTVTKLTDTANKMTDIVPTKASATNQLTDKEYVDNAIKNNAARAISADEDGAGFASLDALKAGPWYSLGESTTPTANDYAVVKKDASHDGNDVRYNYDGAVWLFFQEFTSGNSVTFTTSQQLAIDSGITAAKVTQIQTNSNNLLIEETARIKGDADLAADIEKRVKEASNKIGDITALNTDVKTSIVEAMNDLHNELHNERLACDGSNKMTGQLDIVLADSGDILLMKAGDKGVNFNLDATTGVMGIIPESAPTAGVSISVDTIMPRTNVIPYSLGSNENKWANLYVSKINDNEPITLNTVVSMLYPVGSIYVSVDATFDPNTTWTGTTWEKIKEGIFLEATEVADTIGTEKEAGLPNIKGNSYNVQGVNYNADGAFTKTGAGNSGWSGNVTGLHHLHFNASLSSAVYGKSDTVQPHSITCFMWKRTA